MQMKTHGIVLWWRRENKNHGEISLPNGKKHKISLFDWRFPRWDEEKGEVVLASKNATTKRAKKVGRISPMKGEELVLVIQEDPNNPDKFIIRWAFRHEYEEVEKAHAVTQPEPAA